MSFWNDVRYGIRTLRKAPGFSATSIVTLALGIGATTAIFSVCDALLWKPIPLPHLDRLAVVWQAEPSNPNDGHSNAVADIDDVRRQNQSFEKLTHWGRGLANIVGSSGEPERVSQGLTATDFFDVLGVQPAIGRGFQPGEDEPGRERVVVLSERLWRRRFAADPNIAGKTIRLDDQNFQVVGVMPHNFDFPKPAELWTPYAMSPEARKSRTALTVMAMGLLRPGVAVQQARSELNTIAARLEQEYPDSNKNRRFRVDTAHEFLIGSYAGQYVRMLFGASLFVLLIACANVANLHFARASGRSREVAVRTAMGVGRWRLIRQLMTESVLLSLAGAAAGLVVAAWGIETIRSGMPAEVERYITGWKEIQLDARALAFTLTAAVLTGILAGIAPALQGSRANLNDALKEGGRGGSSGRAKHRLRAILVAAEITLAVVLLVGASLMVRGFNNLVNASTTMEPATLLTFRLAVTETKYKERHRQEAFYREVLERTAAIPGVRSAVAASAMPYSDHLDGREFDVEGRPAEPGNSVYAMYQSVSPNFFETLHVPLLNGRLLQTGDGSGTPPVAVISDRMARRWWPNEAAPVGRRIRVRTPTGKAAWVSIVGVVDNIPTSIWDRAPRPVVYVPYQQAPQAWMGIAVRTAGDPTRLTSAAVAAVRAVDPEQPVTDIATMERLRQNQGVGLTYMAVLMGVFGMLALALSSIGVYGVMAYLVSEETHEIGIRMALGASRGNVLGMIFRRGMVTIAVGLTAGIALAYGMARLMSSLVFGVTASDPATFLGIPLALVLAAAYAIWVPARRATRIDPLAALRHE